MRRTSILARLFAATLLFAVMALACAADDMTTAFGPKQYQRNAGPPQTFTDTFSRCGTAGCRIVVTNGNPDGSGRISSASIYVNGVLVFGPSDFNQNVGTLAKPVVLGDTNQVRVVLTSKPGSFLTVTVECAASPVTLALGGAGVNLLTPTTLLSAVPVENTGTAAASNVQLSSITLPGSTLSSPASLPYSLGTIAAGSSAVLNTTFNGSFAALATYPLELKGTYEAAGATYCFDLTGALQVPPASPGSAPLGTVTLPPLSVDGTISFPARPPSPNEDEVNNPIWTVPTAPFQPGAPPPGSTEIMPAELTASLDFLPQGVGMPFFFDPPPTVVFDTNNGIGITSGVSGTAEPSGASGGGVVFVTYNWGAAYSTDGGSTFTALDPTTIFPADAIGYCCDQVVQYVPSIDRFVWLLQGTGFRLATASPAQIISSHGRAWTYWNLAQTVFGSCTGFDYPDMSTGNNSLYLSWDAGGGASGCGGLQVVRTSFAGIGAGGTITVEFTQPSHSSMAWGSHLMHYTDNEIFWAGHNSNSNMRIFSLAEGSNTYFWRDVGISSWANNSPLTSNSPDSQNWINFLMNPTSQNPGGGFPKNAILGSTRVGNQLWFAWSAGTDGNFSKPHIEMVTLDRSDFHKIQQVQIWNPDYAFAYPALARNACSNEIGLSFEYGGGGNYENHVVGFWGDFVAYQTTGSNAGSTRFGDYVSIRQMPPTDADPGNLFTAYGYGRRSTSGGGTVSDVHYVVFGRPAEVCAPIIK